MGSAGSVLSAAGDTTSESKMFRAAAKLRECHRETKQTNPYGTNQNTPPLGNNEHPFGNLPNDPYGNFPRAR